MILICTLYLIHLTMQHHDRLCICSYIHICMCIHYCVCVCVCVRACVSVCVCVCLCVLYSIDLWNKNMSAVSSTIAKGLYECVSLV